MATPSASVAAAAKEASPKWIGTSEDHCQAMIDRATKHSPMVKFMIDKLAEAGCGIGKDFIRIESCDIDVGGGFRPPDGIVICHNHLASQVEVDHALTHELIHAYDHCRAKDLDWCNCEHHACSEVRAASLSGDCDWKMEVQRGNLSLKGQHQKCVRRRAELSVAMNPHCAGGKAAAAVESVFQTCFADTAPFDRRP